MSKSVRLLHTLAAVQRLLRFAYYVTLLQMGVRLFYTAVRAVRLIRGKG